MMKIFQSRGAAGLDPKQVAKLEDRFVLELRVASDIFGCTATEWKQSAQKALASDHFEHCLDAWRHGKREAWARLNALAGDLRRATGDTRSEWEARLTRLEIAARREIQAVHPSPGSALQPWPEDDGSNGLTRRPPA